MNNNIQIKAYTKADKNILISILQANVPKYFHSTEVALYENFLDRIQDDYFIVCYNNNIVGAGGIYTVDEGKTGALSWGFLHPDYHGLGLGKELLLYRIKALKSIESVEKIIVRTSQLVYKFFEKQGFILQSTEDNYWAPGLHLYEMLYKE